MNNWNISEAEDQLFRQLKDVDNSIENQLKELFDEIILDKGLVDLLNEEKLKDKVSTYLLRYVLPLYELLKKEKKQQKTINNSLIVQLLCCAFWRALDNCIDKHDSVSNAQRILLSICMYLFDFSKSCTSTQVLPVLGHHYKMMLEQADIEKSRPIQLNDIWKRCSIFLFAGETIGKLSEESMDIYKMYLNYTGLAHDAHDLFSDLSSQTQSLPKYWMYQLNSDAVYSVTTVKLLYEKIRIEVQELEKNFEILQIEIQFPIINRLLQDSWHTFHDE